MNGCVKKIKCNFETGGAHTSNWSTTVLVTIVLYGVQLVHDLDAELIL